MLSPLFSCGSICPTSSLLQRRCCSQTGAGQFPGAAQEQGDAKRCCGECEPRHTTQVFWIGGNEKRSTLLGSFLDKSSSDELLRVHLGKFWQHSPDHFKLYISESWQQEQTCSVCVCDNFKSQAVSSDWSSWLLGPPSSQRGRSDGGL